MPKLDLSHLDAATLLLPEHHRLHFVLVGCGGTGSWLAPSVARFARLLQDQRKDVLVTFCDGDHVEAKNIYRQNFCDAEIGCNKAETLAARFSLAWGVNIQAFPSRFTNQSLPRNANDLTIILGCVDNAAARQAIHHTLQEHSKLNGQVREWWLDCGNAEDSGQVYFGAVTDKAYLAKKPFVSDRVCVKLPAPSLVDPELLKARPEETASKKMSCAEVQLANTQSLSVNQQVAAIASDYLLRVITGTLQKYATFFDLQTGSMRSKYITRKELRNYCRKEAKAE